MISRKSDRELNKAEDEEADKEGEKEKEIFSDKDAITSNEENEKLCSLKEREVDRVWRNIWPHLNCYLLPVDDYTRWFLMDEVRTYLCMFLPPFFSLFLLLFFLLSSLQSSLLLPSSIVQSVFILFFLLPNSLHFPYLFSLLFFLLFSHLLLSHSFPFPHTHSLISYLRLHLGYVCLNVLCMT